MKNSELSSHAEPFIVSIEFAGGALANQADKYRNFNAALCAVPLISVGEGWWARGTFIFGPFRKFNR